MSKRMRWPEGVKRSLVPTQSEREESPDSAGQGGR